MKELKEAVLKAIYEYNKYHSPEAKAELMEIREDNLTIIFEGPFCLSCGVYDYFEDLIYEIKRLIDIEIEIIGFKEHELGKFKVEYALKYGQ